MVKVMVMVVTVVVVLLVCLLAGDGVATGYSTPGPR